MSRVDHVGNGEVVVEHDLDVVATSFVEGSKVRLIRANSLPAVGVIVQRFAAKPLAGIRDLVRIELASDSPFVNGDDVLVELA